MRRRIRHGAGRGNRLRGWTLRRVATDRPRRKETPAGPRRGPRRVNGWRWIAWRTVHLSIRRTRMVARFRGRGFFFCRRQARDYGVVAQALAASNESLLLHTEGSKPSPINENTS